MIFIFYVLEKQKKYTETVIQERYFCIIFKYFKQNSKVGELETISATKQCFK